MTDRDPGLDHLLDDTVPLDPAARAAYDAARADVAAIRRGLALVAAEAAARPSRRRAVALAAAVLVPLAVAGALLAGRDGDVGERAGGPTPGASVEPTPSRTTEELGFGIIEPTLRERVAEAERIVLGTVVRIERHTVEGDPYVVLDVAVDEALKGPDDDVAVLAADVGGPLLGPDDVPRDWRLGDRVLLFLVPDPDPRTRGVRPGHLVVPEGVGGRYLYADGRLVAPFTLDDVRAETR